MNVTMTAAESIQKRRDYLKAWTVANQDRVRSNKARYRHRKREELRAKSLEYAAAHRAERSEYGRLYYSRNKEKMLARESERRQNNRQYFTQWRQANKDHIAQHRRERNLLSPELRATARLKRRAEERQARPTWANGAAIRAFYLEAARLARETGVPHEVDHIFPITSRLVCGLHCEANLQILTTIENRTKGNRLPK